MGRSPRPADTLEYGIVETGARGGIKVAYDFHNWFAPVRTQVVAKLKLYKTREDVNLCEMLLQFLDVVSLINLMRQRVLAIF